MTRGVLEARWMSSLAVSTPNEQAQLIGWFPHTCASGASACILDSWGELNTATSLVDDEGVDLVFNRRGSPATLAAQVGARMPIARGCRLVNGWFLRRVRAFADLPASL
jgi:hypothetical protein